VSHNEVILLKQVSDDRTFAHAVSELQIYANKKHQISSSCLDRFYLSTNFSGIVF